MAREKQLPPPDEEQGAPEWMVTFSDCMTLLLTFFVLLLSFSSFDEKEHSKLKVIYASMYNSIYSNRQSSKESLVEEKRLENTSEIDSGSEKPTLETGKDGLLKETFDDDFRSHKVFLINSEKIFLGKGTAISTQGQETLSNLADFMKMAPARVVISENPCSLSTEDSEIGFSRAWSVINHLKNKHNIERDRFSISAESTMGSDGFSVLNLKKNEKCERMLEIILLERGIYN